MNQSSPDIGKLIEKIIYENASIGHFGNESEVDNAAYLAREIIRATQPAAPDAVAARASNLAERIRAHVMSRGGPAKDENGKYVGTVWPMMLEAADELDRLRGVAQPPAQSKAEWFCEWLQGYLTPITGHDELDAFDANTIRNTLNETMGSTPTSSTDRGSK